MWSYHSVDGWYLSTSPEHYRVHNCYVKTTQAERLTDTIQFKHKNITNPTISPQDKIMHALANCKNALTGMMNGTQMEELQTLLTKAHAHLEQRKETNSHQVPRVETQHAPRVETNETTYFIPSIPPPISPHRLLTPCVSNSIVSTNLRYIIVKFYSYTLNGTFPSCR